MRKSKCLLLMTAASLAIIVANVLLADGQLSIEEKTQRQSIDRTRKRQTIPVEIPHLIFVSVRVKDSEPLRFILDSASKWTFVDSSVAATLGLKTEGHRSLQGAGEGSVDVQFAHDVPVDISGVRLNIKDLAVTSLRNKPYQGLIGADLFKQFAVEVDYERQVVNLFDPRSFKYAGGGEVLPLKLRDDIPVITASVITRSRAHLIARLDVDTGASQTFLFTRHFFESNKLLESTKGMLRMSAGGLGGGSSYLLGRIKTLKLGRFSFEDWMAGFSQDQKGAGVATDRDGVLGNGLLKRFTVIFDYSRNRVILEPNSLIDVPFDYDWCGFNIVGAGKDFRIDRVVRDTQASDAGLQVGDIVLAVDGKSSSELKVDQLRRLFKQDGHEYVLEVKRNDLAVRIKLQTISIP